MKSFAFVSIGIALPFLLAGGAQAQFGTPSGILSGLDRPTVHPPIDMDNDGDLDLVLQDDTGKVAFWLENTDGQGNFILADTFGTGLPINAKIAMGDLFLDGYPDMVVAVNDTIRYREQNTLGQWGAPALVQGGVNVTVVRIADMTGDTLPEIVTLRGTPFDLIWYHNTATPPFSTSTTLGITGGPAPGDLDIADLNGDGFRDAFCMNWNGNGVAALSLDALGTQWEVDTLFSGLYLDQAEVLDLDGDGDMDIAKRNGIGVQWMRNNGNG
ncbi:MAG: VCBS repeat-containing protein, partial [Flavobacteriales bacterium]|nr:VCBS repeat-containing protein [Flavobacteriales bacterium]